MLAGCWLAVGPVFPVRVDFVIGRLVGKPLYQQPAETEFYAMSHAPLLAHRLAQIEKARQPQPPERLAWD